MAPRAGARRARSDDPLARAELLIALGDVRWQASEPGARAAFDEAAELARRHDAPEALARAVLGAGGRLLHADRAPTPPTSRGSRRRSPRSATPTGPLRARLLARLAEHLALADAGDRPARLGAEAVAMARARRRRRARSPPRCMGRHAALLDIDHVEERLAVIDEALAVAERLGGGRARRARAALAHLRPRRARRRRRRPRRAHERLEALAHELHQPLYTHAALAWRGVVGAPRRAARGGRADRTASRCGSPRRPARPRRARSSSRSCSPSGASRAASASCSTRSSGSPASAGPVGVSWRAPLPLVLSAGRRARARPRRLRGRARRRRFAGAARQPLPPHRAHLRRRGVRRARRRGRAPTR